MEDLDALLLGSPPDLTRAEVVERVGVTDEQAHAVWTAMGFAEVPDGVPAFTHADVAALQTASEILGLGVVGEDTLLALTRAMGQGMARLAEGQVDAFRALAGGLSVDESIHAAATAAVDVIPRLESLVAFVWRRQFAAAVQRSLAAAREDGMPLLTVAFIDLVDFTRSTRKWDHAQLESTLEHFESETSLRVAAVGGQVVKTLGDGVLLTTASVEDAVAIALDTAAAHDVDDDLPAVRAGVATGPVLLRLGDVFGQPVNLASRLADEARPSSVLLDDRAAEALADHDGFVVKPLHKRAVRGYRSLSPHLVRRAAPTA